MEKIKPVEYHPSHDETIFAMFNKINEIIDWINGFEEGNEYSKKVLKTLEEDNAIQKKMIKFIMENTPTALHPSHKPEFSLQDLWDERFIKEYHDKVGDAIMNEYIGEPTVKERYCKGIKEIKFNQPVEIETGVEYEVKTNVKECKSIPLGISYGKEEKIEEIIDKFKEEFSGLRYFLNNSETNITFLDEIESWLRDKLNKF